MARSFAQIGTSFWSEPSIRALTRDAQRAYLLVHSQPELSRCGVLPFRLKRLAQLSIDDSPRTLRKAFTQLEKGRHFVVDEDAEEILVRTYVRHDGLLAQPNVVANMCSDYSLIASESLRIAFLAELRRIWDVDLKPAERGGWLLAVGVYPDRKGGKDDPRSWPEAMAGDSLARLTKAVGAGLIAPMIEAITRGQVDPFTEASPPGLPEPLANATPNPSPKGLRGRDRGESRAPAPSAGSESRAPSAYPDSENTLSPLSSNGPYHASHPE